LRRLLILQDLLTGIWRASKLNRFCSLKISAGEPQGIEMSRSEPPPIAIRVSKCFG
jgi:hypothetical protein